MFINFWYPAEESTKVTRKPLKVRMLGLNFVLWRDEAGKAHCISNTCTHRGGSLGDGKLVGDCIQCPYHGWLFNGEGRCERIPSLGPLEVVPDRAHIDAYPVEERYGLVFVFLGDLPEDGRPTIMPNPEYGQDGWRALHTRYTWNCNYVRLVENQTDPSHVEYVHSGMGMAGQNDDYKVPRIDIEEYDWGAGAMVKFQTPGSPDEEVSKVSSRGQSDAGSGYHGICSTWTHVHFNKTDRFYPLLFTVPRDEMELELFQIAMRNCRLDEKYDRNFRERIGVAIDEDRIVVEKLDPPIPSGGEIGEFIVPADDVLMHYRNARRQWEANGWHIDTEKMKATRDHIAYAIPSPARRLRPDGWAVTPVPPL